LGAIGKGSRRYTIPADDQLDVIEIGELEDTATGLYIVFSNPLKKGQDLRSYITFSNQNTPKFSIEDNIVRVYSSEELSSTAELHIKDLVDEKGNKLVKPVAYSKKDSWDLPEVRFTHKGTILPTTQGATLVIETKNLSGVIVEAFKIHNTNMIQFLQVNKLEGSRELYRVGEPVWSKKFDLLWSDNNQNAWIPYMSI